jgi:hypothetical protein
MRWTSLISMAVVTAFVLNGSIVFAQNNKGTVFLRTNNEEYSYYIVLNNANGVVYEIKNYLDEACDHAAYSIISTDSLINLAEGGYEGAHTKIVAKNYKAYLITKDKKTRKFKLNIVSNRKKIYTTLNNAYFFDNFYTMRYELLKNYRLYYSSQNGFDIWNNLPNTDIDPLQFSIYANEKLKQIKDSIGLIHDPYASFTKKVIGHLKTIDYNRLRDTWLFCGIL